MDAGIHLSCGEGLSPCLCCIVGEDADAVGPAVVHEDIGNGAIEIDMQLQLFTYGDLPGKGDGIDAAIAGITDGTVERCQVEGEDSVVGIIGERCLPAA